MSPTQDSTNELAQEAMRAYRRGDLPAAADGFRAAVAAYAKSGEDLAAAEAANNLCVVLLAADRPQEALECVRPTPAVFEKHQDRVRAAQAHGNLGSALEGCGQLVEAEAAYVRSLDLFRAIPDRDGESLVLRRLSQVRLRQGKPVEALASLQASLDVAPRGGLLRRWVRKLISLPTRFLSS